MIMRKTLLRIPTHGDAERNAREQGYEARRGATAFNPVPRLGIRHKSSVRNHSGDSHQHQLLDAGLPAAANVAF
jgi:hypothetical protein